MNNPQITLRQFWFAANTTRTAAGLEPLLWGEVRDLYQTYLADLERDFAMSIASARNAA